MISDYLEFDPAIIEKRQVYRLLTGAVVPRPIGWASTVDKNAITNLAPFSFFTVVCVIPPMISLTIARNPDGTEKHTLKNVRETGEFCFNVVTEPVWRKMVDSANAFPASDSEFAKTGLTPIPSVKIAAPRVKEVPIHFECKLERVLELGSNHHPLVIGEVVYMHVDPSCMTDGSIDMKKLNPIGRLNGFFYASWATFSSASFSMASHASGAMGRGSQILVLLSGHPSSVPSEQGSVGSVQSVRVRGPKLIRDGLLSMMLHKGRCVCARCSSK